MHLLYPFAKRFIAGETLKTALPNIQSLNHLGFLSTIDVLGENVYTVHQAQAARQEYLDLIQAIDELHFPLDISIKLTQMGLNIDPDLCRNNINKLIQAAGKHTVRFDMEGSDTTDRTIQLGRDLHRAHNNLGLVLQAYLLRTESDVETVIRERISTRLCKGAYKEPPEVAYQDKNSIQENFLKLAFRLLKEGFMPAMATHDEFLIQEIIQFVEKENISPKTFYFELLYGVRRDLQKILLGKGYQVRIYVPYGNSWLPYTLRRLAERKENIFFVLKSLARETFGLGKFH